MLRLRLSQVFHALPKEKIFFLKILLFCSCVHVIFLAVGLWCHKKTASFVKINNTQGWAVPIVLASFDESTIPASSALLKESTIAESKKPEAQKSLNTPPLPPALKDTDVTKAEKKPDKPIAPQVITKTIPQKAIKSQTIAPKAVKDTKAQTKKVLPPQIKEKKVIKPIEPFLKKIENKAPQLVAAIPESVQTNQNTDFITSSSIYLGALDTHQDVDMQSDVKSIEVGLSALWKGSSIHPSGKRCRLKITIDRQGTATNIIQDECSSSMVYNMAARNAVAQFTFPPRFWNQEMILEF